MKNPDRQLVERPLFPRIRVSSRQLVDPTVKVYHRKDEKGYT